MDQHVEPVEQAIKSVGTMAIGLTFAVILFILIF